MSSVSKKMDQLQKDTWEIEVVSQLNHDLFSLTSTMKSGWQINWRWKRNGIEIDLFKKGHDSFRFDRVIPSGSSWLMGVKVKTIVGRAHSLIEKGKKIPIQKTTLHDGTHRKTPY